jgi:hypothetical protein
MIGEICDFEICDFIVPGTRRAGGNARPGVHFELCKQPGASMNIALRAMHCRA